MLEELGRLKGTITDEQLEFIEDVAGEELFELFESALDASTEEQARAKVSALSIALGKNPLKAFKVYNKLDSNQKDLILGLMEDENE